MMDLTPERADFMARSFVNGMVDEIKHGQRTGRKVIHTAHWSPVFLDHPWVKASEVEGWARDLRTAVVLAVKRRIMGRRPYHDIEQLMPQQDLIEFWRDKAARERRAAEWQAAHFVKYSGKANEPRPLEAATRDVFMRRMSGSRT